MPARFREAPKVQAPKAQETGLFFILVPCRLCLVSSILACLLQD
jgi:hypothetical protein